MGLTTALIPAPDEHCDSSEIISAKSVAGPGPREDINKGAITTVTMLVKSSLHGLHRSCALKRHGLY